MNITSLLPLITGLVLVLIGEVVSHDKELTYIGVGLIVGAPFPSALNALPPNRTRRVP